MLPPFETLEALQISQQLSASKRYLVTQTYYREVNVANPAKPTSIIVFAYDDLALATIHKNALGNDRLRSILDLQDDNHRKLIVDMIEGSRYLVYWAVINDYGLLETASNSAKIV